MQKTLSLLAAAALATPALAQANDDCSGAITLTAGTSVAFDTSAATLSGAAFGCASGGAPDLWYTYTAPTAGNVIEFETCGSSYDTAIEVFTGDCNNLALVDCNDDSCGLQSAISTVAPAANTDYYVRVGGWNGATGAGTIIVTDGVAPPPPCTNSPDMFEPNTDCSTAVALSDGMYTGLDVEDIDNDYYAVTVPDGNTLNVDIFFTDADGDVDLLLWDPAIDCNFNAGGSLANALDTSRTVTDDESVSYTNTTGAPIDLIIEVDMWTAGACNDYDMTIVGAQPAGPGPIGTAFCPGNVNSTGLAGETTAFGELEVAANDVTLTAANVPAGQFGIFVVSQTEVPPVPVGEGLLCLGGALGRYNGPGQILQAGPSGEFSLSIDLGMIPEPMQFVAAQPGDTFLFQAWYRDFNMMGNTSNFTSGVELNFN